jgi:uncharacterized membrane protein
MTEANQDAGGSVSPESHGDRPASIERVGGRLHSIHHLRDGAGKVIGTIAKPLKTEFHAEDLFQQLVGAFVMALPFALTGDVWDLGETLSTGRILSILVVSLITLAAFVWSLFYASEPGDHWRPFLKRVVSAYLVTFFVALLLLFLVDQAPLDDLRVAFSRAVIVAFPASFSATVTDFVK